MSFELDQISPSVRIQILFVGEMPERMAFLGFRVPEGVPMGRVTFDNRNLFYTHPELCIIELYDYVLRALNWKEGDELCWTVYNDRTNFFKKVDI